MPRSSSWAGAPPSYQSSLASSDDRRKRSRARSARSAGLGPYGRRRRRRPRAPSASHGEEGVWSTTPVGSSCAKGASHPRVSGGADRVLTRRGQGEDGCGRVHETAPTRRTAPGAANRRATRTHRCRPRPRRDHHVVGGPRPTPRGGGRIRTVTVRSDPPPVGASRAGARVVRAARRNDSNEAPRPAQRAHASAHDPV